MINNEVIIYEEDETGIVKHSALEDYMRVSGVWALYAKEKESHKYVCLNVGKSTDVGNEVLYDIGCLHFLKIRQDGDENYVNQFGEDCDFKYKSGQTQEYLYPIVASNYNSFKFIYIHNKSSANIEKEYANEHHSIYWRNGSPYGVKKRINLTSPSMLKIGELFLDGSEVYSHNDLLIKIEELLGYNKSRGERLIKDCLKAGFLTQMNEQTYTR